MLMIYAQLVNNAFTQPGGRQTILSFGTVSSVWLCCSRGTPIVQKNHWATLVSESEDTNKLNSIVLATVYYHADTTAF